MTDEHRDQPDLTNGIPETDLADGAMLIGRVGEETVLLARRGQEIFAIGASCTHYGGPLGEGLMVDDTVRCPWHHACFSLRTGEALAAPALNATSCWQVDRSGGRIVVRDKISDVGRPMPVTPRAAAGVPGPMVIVGGGAAGYAAAEMLRREGYGGRVTIVSADDAPPYDRPNLSKDYLAGTAPEEWIPLRPAEFYADSGIELRLRTTATAIDLSARRIMLAGGESLPFDKLLLATGAEPIRLQVPGVESAACPNAALARRQPRADRPRPQGTPRGDRRRQLHRARSRRALCAIARSRSISSPPRLGRWSTCSGPRSAISCASCTRSMASYSISAARWPRSKPDRVRLDDGAAIPADLVVVGIGVRPRLELAQQAGLAIDRGVLVDEYLETSAPGIFAAGDIARWPDRLQRREAAYRALGRCRTARSDGGPQHAWAARAVQSRPVLLEPALRRVDRLCRPRRRRGTGLFRMATQPRMTRRCALKRAVASWRLRRSFVAARAYWRNSRWSKVNSPRRN